MIYFPKNYIPWFIADIFYNVLLTLAYTILCTNFVLRIVFFWQQSLIALRWWHNYTVQNKMYLASLSCFVMFNDIRQLCSQLSAAYVNTNWKTVTSPSQTIHILYTDLFLTVKKAPKWSKTRRLHGNHRNETYNPQSIYITIFSNLNKFFKFETTWKLHYTCFGKCILILTGNALKYLMRDLHVGATQHFEKKTWKAILELKNKQLDFSMYTHTRLFSSKKLYILPNVFLYNVDLEIATMHELSIVYFCHGRFCLFQINFLFQIMRALTKEQIYCLSEIRYFLRNYPASIL